MMTLKSFVVHNNFFSLTHWGWVTNISVGKLAIIGSDNGLSPGRRQAIIRTNAGILSIGSFGRNFNKEILIEILAFSFKKLHLKMSYAKWRPFCLGLNVLTDLVCIFCSIDMCLLDMLKWQLYSLIGKANCFLREFIFKRITVNNISFKNARMCVYPNDLGENNSMPVKVSVMACFLIAPSHNLNWYWSRCMMPYHIIRPQCVN